MKKTLILLISVFFICGCGQKVKYKTIELDEVKQKIKEGAYLVDVRTNTEYKEEHIPGAINIPLDDIENYDKKIISKEDVVIVYCKSGGRSKQAADKLIRNGYKYVYDFGAITNWK